MGSYVQVTTKGEDFTSTITIRHVDGFAPPAGPHSGRNNEGTEASSVESCNDGLEAPAVPIKN